MEESAAIAVSVERLKELDYGTPSISEKID